MMKKNNLLILAVAALGFAACANDETTAVNEKLAESNAISFRSVISGNMRAANGYGVKTTPWEVGDKLYVTAERTVSATTSKYFQDQFVYDGNGFYSENKYYWPSDIDANNLTFTAFWGAEQKTWAAAGDGKSLAAAYTVPDAVGSQKDLLFAMHTQNSKPTDGGVLLNFRHMLSQIVVKVANDQPNLKITITGVRVGYLNKVGTFTYTGIVTDTKETSANNATKIARANWALTDDALKDATYLFQQDVTSTVLDGKTDAQAFAGFTSWILMPQQLTAAMAYTAAVAPASATHVDPATLDGAYLALKMVIVDKNTDAPIVAEQWCYWPIGTEWKPGYKYTYTINAGSGGYEPTDQDNNTDLDPVLDNLVIWFQPTCTIDAWVPENYGISAPIARTASYNWGSNFTTGANENINLIAGANGSYTIIISGLTVGHTVTASATNNFTAAPTVSDGGTVPANGTLTITGTLSANTTASVSSVITITDTTAEPDEAKTITIIQAAPAE